MDCDNLYRKFGFECNPLLINIGQQCVKMIFDKVKESQEYMNIVNESFKRNENKGQQYCKIHFAGVNYCCENVNKNEEELFYEIISKRKIKLSSSNFERRKSFLKKHGKTKRQDTLQDRKEKIKSEGKI